MSKKRATMNDVAKLAGVTQATVSYVINNSANVSDEVKERVYDAVKKLDYRPNYIARALKTSNSDIIGIILPDIVNQYYSRMVEHLESLMIESGHHTMVYTTSYNPNYEKDIIMRLLSYDVQSIVVLYQLSDAANWNVLKLSGKPIIALEGGSYCSQIGIPNMHTDSFYGGYTATRHLLDTGAEKIAFIHQTAVNESLHDRFLGYSQAMKDAGLYHVEDIYYIENTANRYKEYEKVGSQLAGMPYDGIVATSDLIAFGLIRQFKMHGKSVPEDVRIVGYDNVPLADLCIPSLTTISQPIEEICEGIIGLLFSPDGEKPSVDMKFKPELIIRESA